MSENQENSQNIIKKPKILVFSFTYFPFIGGAEVAIQEIAKRPEIYYSLVPNNLPIKYPK